jgi:hypothetical protein
MNEMGLGTLLRFVPDFVRFNCLSRDNHSTLMEHRRVTILFIVADMTVGRLLLFLSLPATKPALLVPGTAV